MKKPKRITKALRLLVISVVAIAVAWTSLTIWVEKQGREDLVTLGDMSDSTRVLIVYDPDPIYNLDEQVCRGFAKGLVESNIQVVLATTRAAKKLDLLQFKNIVVCANTYNWAPDGAVIDFIDTSKGIAGKNVVAITVGSGSTSEAREKLEKKILTAGGNIILSKEWWLMKPNNESRMEEKNVDVAVDLAYHTGLSLSDTLKRSAF
jgi:flavorubredoxin